MPLFRLKKGTEVRGSRRERQVFRVGDVIESDDNLAAMEPERYERVSEEQAQWYQANPQSRKLERPGPDRPEVADAPAPAGPAPNRLSAASTVSSSPGAAAQAQTQAAPAPTTHVTPTTKAAHPHAKKSIEEEYGDLNDQTVDDLKEIAAAEKVDLKGVTKKDDIIKALRSAHK